jgi:predicted dehydrogenase
MAQQLSRREMIQQATLAAGLTALGGVWMEGARAQSKSPNERLNIACVGVGGQGAYDLSQVKSENIVALCDVDRRRAAGAFNEFEEAKKYSDFRKMFDEMGKSIDAVVVSTPDHCHAVVAAMALRMGKHVYCQKPITHSVYEARVLTQMASKAKVATQMGTQGHSFPAHAQMVEMIQSGAIGPVNEVHVWTDRAKGWWPQGVRRPSTGQSVPSSLDWDMWLGPAQERPYHSAYLPFIWRGWWDFGTGALGDMACHLMDCAFWALNLGAPYCVEAKGEGMTEDSPPVSAIIHYKFPAREGMPPVTLVWYDGGNQPSPDLFLGETVPKVDNGSLFIGEKGRMLVNHGEKPLLLPSAQFKDYQPPAPTLRRSPGHYAEWIQACKTGSPTGSHFGYAGPMTEAILLGNVALRVGKPIEWDARRMKAKGCPEADRFIRPAYRKGWKL